MGFNAEKFRVAEFVHRTEIVPVPMLADYFDKGSKPEIIIRGLSAEEVFMTLESGNSQRTIDDVLASIESNESKVNQIREIIGIDNKVSPEFVRKLHQFLAGVVEPKIERDIALKIQRAFPMLFLDITNRINALSGLGMNLKKSGGSGEEPM
jgi:hypothetical protein